MDEKMVAVNVRIPESLLTRVDAVAEVSVVSRRVVVEQAVRDFVDLLAQGEAVTDAERLKAKDAEIEKLTRELTFWRAGFKPAQMPQPKEAP
jgi:predicted transcriptional regulator